MNISIVALGIKVGNENEARCECYRSHTQKIPTKNSFAYPFREIDKLCELVPIAKRS